MRSFKEWLEKKLEEEPELKKEYEREKAELDRRDRELELMRAALPLQSSVKHVKWEIDESSVRGRNEM